MKRAQKRQHAERPNEPGPVRTCLGCGKKQLKRLLHRLVLDAQRQPVLDRPQGAPGRGAYLCGPGCLKAAIKKKAFQRALKGPNNQLEVAAPSADWARTMEADLQTKH